MVSLRTNITQFCVLSGGFATFISLIIFFGLANLLKGFCLYLKALRLFRKLRERDPAGFDAPP